MSPILVIFALIWQDYTAYAGAETMS